jgi:hypothetical protein
LAFFLCATPGWAQYGNKHQINISGATLFQGFFQAPASTNDHIDVDGDGHKLFDPWDFDTPDQLAWSNWKSIDPDNRWILMYRGVGSGNGLAVRKSLWNKICANIPSVKVKRGCDLYPYIGRLDCKKAVIPKLQVGGRLVNNALISVFPDDCPLLDESEALLGMQYFLDTALALDFEKSLLWVKN